MKLQKKFELKRVMDEDTTKKNAFRNVNSSQMSLNKDFGDNNVLQYLYTKKEHQSIQLGKKKEYMIDLMKDQFQGSKKMEEHESKTFQRDVDAAFKKYDNTTEAKKLALKKQEMETKLFQDRQIAEKEKVKELEKLSKLGDHSVILKEVEDFYKAEEHKKQEKFMKNKKHLDQVIKQMGQEPKMFAKTGVAIVKNGA